MEEIKVEKKLCILCMEEHGIRTVKMSETEEFKGTSVEFEAVYEYCDQTDELLETEEYIKSNSLAMKDAYRRKVGLLTSDEIIAIREKYKLSQKNFSEVLDWGRATITRYENHQVQDRAHDDVLRKINSDPKWMLQMLDRARDKIPSSALNSSLLAAKEEFSKMHNQYLIDSIQSIYANLHDEDMTGGVQLNLNKVVEIINYFATKIKSLHKVKLMKMLWYADYLNYKRHEKSITGLVYGALPMGAVPKGSEIIIDLDGIKYEEVLYDHVAYRFLPVEGIEFNSLTNEEVDTLETVIAEVGDLNTQDIIKKMHSEEAYKCTSANEIISFKYADQLSID